MSQRAFKGWKEVIDKEKKEKEVLKHKEMMWKKVNSWLTDIGKDEDSSKHVSEVSDTNES